MGVKQGRQSTLFHNDIFIESSASVCGEKESAGPLGEKMDFVFKDPFCGKNTWEEAESRLIEKACSLAIKDSKRDRKDIRAVFSGDLLGQLIASSFGVKDLGIPFYGVYGACASIGAAISMASAAVDGGWAESTLAVSSSHFGSAEKEFRFPLGYGNQRPYSATWTATGAGAFVIGKRKRTLICIRGFTTGIIKDYGVKDPFNMGACMAPAAADTISGALADFEKKAEDFDKIITGDLGQVGSILLYQLLEMNGIHIRERHIDCGLKLYKEEKQDVHSGGSGCACSALVLATDILPRLQSGEWKNVLFVPTGALLSQITYNEQRTIPSVAHAIWFQKKEK